MNEISKLVLAVPSKGRLQENTQGFFARAGMNIIQAGGAREYRGALDGIPNVEIAFLSASEIVGQLANGAVHLGVSGEDLVRECHDSQAKLELLAPLGFGFADVVVAVPEAWIDVRSMADLEDVAADFHARHGKRLRVATKYIQQTRKAFARSGIREYQIVESLGATEGAPATGYAEIIVDITTTGATLKANGLKILHDGLLLASQANLVASLTACWNLETLKSARAFLNRILAKETACTMRDVHAWGLGGSSVLTTEASILFNALPLDESHSGLGFTLPKSKVAAFADWLIDNGARRVTSQAHENVFLGFNTLFSRLEARLKPEGSSEPGLRSVDE